MAFKLRFTAAGDIHLSELENDPRKAKQLKATQKPLDIFKTIHGIQA